MVKTKTKKHPEKRPAKHPKAAQAEPPELPIVVGIGSSAGGLEAVREFVASLPIDSGASYVIVQHMSPQHKSLMTPLVASETNVKVTDAVDGITVEPNVIYITPPRKDVLIKNGRLCLVDSSKDAGKPKPSVDRFLTSLAEDRGEKSVAIILSGTGSDGACGVQAIREQGGITIAQDGMSAKYDGMANAAIETGCIDLILRPSEIGTHLKNILLTPRNLDQFKGREDVASPLTSIEQILLAQTRVDFREYKQSTIQRRIDRRMVTHEISTVEEYAAFCRNDPSEVDALFKDLLISVTRFFRDKSEFEDLKPFIKQLVEASTDENPLRIWVAGCATGEEAYSIAITLAEAFGGPTELTRSKTQIFATDIDRSALDHARQGQYVRGALYDLPQDLADKYFIQQGDYVQVVKALRSAIVFSDHNLCQDPPYLNVDLICCRNVMIYFGIKLQNKVLSRLHYAMKPEGYLFVGTAESIGNAQQLFAPDGKNGHIFRKLPLKRRERYAAQTFSASWRNRNPQISQTSNEGTFPSQAATAEGQIFDALVRSLGQNSILISHDFNILRIFGDISPYINMSENTMLVLKLSLLRSPYVEEARSLITLALKRGERRVGIRHIENDDEIVRLEAYPITARHVDEKMTLLTINRWTREEFEQLYGTASTSSGLSPQIAQVHFRELDQELSNTREALQQTIEELETSNEELQSLNEEMQSSNEELQATNEELETSNEELQSSNEELITVNEELQVRSSEMSAMNAELGSILTNVPMPLIVLDNALQVVRASKAATELFKIESPMKMPHISQVHLPVGFPGLIEICNKSLEKGESVIVEFKSQNRHYRLQCAPFMGELGHLIGTTLVFSERLFSKTPEQELTALLEQAPMHMLRIDENGDILSISQLTAKLLGMKPEDCVGQSGQKLLRFSENDTAGDAFRAFWTGKQDRATFALRAELDSPPSWIAAQRFEHRDPKTGQSSVVITGIEVHDKDVTS